MAVLRNRPPDTGVQLQGSQQWLQGDSSRGRMDGTGAQEFPFCLFCEGVSTGLMNE